MTELDLDAIKRSVAANRYSRSGWASRVVEDLVAELERLRDNAEARERVMRQEEVILRAAERERDALRAENRKLRHVLQWVNDQCPGKCSGVCDDALRVPPARAGGVAMRLATVDELVEMGLLEFDEKEKP